MNSPNASDTSRIGVIGCGLMGAGIAEVSARAGLSVTVVEPSQSALDNGRERILASLRRSVARSTAASSTKTTPAESHKT